MSKVLVYADQSASILRLNLVQGSVDKSNFNILCTRELKSGLEGLRLGIIGASHYFELVDSQGEVVLTEVFACVDLDNPRRVVIADNIQKNYSAQYVFPGFDYRIDLELKNWEEGMWIFHALRDSIEIETPKSVGLSFEFPGSEKSANPDFLPLTLVKAIAADDFGFKIETIHAYPNEDMLVYTSTSLRRTS